jgi:hypothetical protein
MFVRSEKKGEKKSHYSGYRCHSHTYSYDVRYGNVYSYRGGGVLESYVVCTRLKS